MKHFPEPKFTVYLFILPLIFLFINTGCSLDYGTASQAQVQNPEFVFYDVRFTRVEQNKKKIQTEASKLEQYSGINAMYGKNVRFVVYDEHEQKSVEGSCDLISADREHDVYHFFSGIDIRSSEYRSHISADNLRWNEKTQILDSGKKDRVRILTETENGTVLKTEGIGFVARKKNLSYSFSEGIKGLLYDTAQTETEEEKEFPDQGQTDTEVQDETEKQKSTLTAQEAESMQDINNGVPYEQIVDGK